MRVETRYSPFEKIGALFRLLDQLDPVFPKVAGNLEWAGRSGGSTAAQVNGFELTRKSTSSSYG